MTDRHLLRGCLVAAAAWMSVLLAGMPAASAQGLEVAPVNVEMLPGTMAATITVTNRADRTAPIQVRSYAWDQANGADHLNPTTDLMVSPPITEVAPGASQVIRLILRRPATQAEQPFRIVLDQIPPAGSPGTVRFAFRLSIPVFVSPEAAVHPVLAWRIANSGTAQAELLVTNTGNKHARILNPALVSSSGAKLVLESKDIPYVLPGATRSWRIQGRLPAGGLLRVVANTDGGPIEQAVSSGGAP